MPTFTPERANLSSPNLRAWLTPRYVTETSPDWRGRRIKLNHQPFILYDAYKWLTNTFNGVRATLNNIQPAGTEGYIPFVPVTLKVGGLIVTDRTDYRSQEAPHFQDYSITQRIEYYMNGRELITNVSFETLDIPPSAINVTYAHLTDGVTLRCVLRTNTPGISGNGPSVDGYQVQIISGLHPHKQR